MYSDAIVSQVLDELGLNLSDELSSKKIQRFCTRAPSIFRFLLEHRVSIAGLPSTGGSLSVAGGKKAEPQAALADADADLEERLNNLRRDWTQWLSDERAVTQAVDTNILESLCLGSFLKV